MKCISATRGRRHDLGVDQAVAELVQDCAAQTELHTRFAVRLRALTQLACSRLIGTGVSIALLDELGDEAKVAAVLRTQRRHLSQLQPMACRSTAGGSRTETNEMTRGRTSTPSARLTSRD